MIFAFDHTHEVGDICSAASCTYAAAKPTLAGSRIFENIPMRILRKATPEEYLAQEIPEDHILPPLVYGCLHIYEIEVLD